MICMCRRGFHEPGGRARLATEKEGGARMGRFVLPPQDDTKKQQYIPSRCKSSSSTIVLSLS